MTLTPTDVRWLAATARRLRSLASKADIDSDAGMDLSSAAAYVKTVATAWRPVLRKERPARRRKARKT